MYANYCTKDDIEIFLSPHLSRFESDVLKATEPLFSFNSIMLIQSTIQNIDDSKDMLFIWGLKWKYSIFFCCFINSF